MQTGELQVSFLAGRRRILIDMVAVGAVVRAHTAVEH